MTPLTDLQLATHRLMWRRRYPSSRSLARSRASRDPRSVGDPDFDRTWDHAQESQWRYDCARVETALMFDLNITREQTELFRETTGYLPAKATVA